MQTLQKVALVLTIIGAINYGIVGLFEYNPLVDMLGNSIILNVLYVIYGVAGLINIGLLFYRFEDKKIKSH